MGGVVSRAAMERESPVPPTFYYNDESKDCGGRGGDYDGEDDVIMPNEYKRGAGDGGRDGDRDEYDDDFLSDTAAMNIVDAVVASSARDLDADDSMSPSFTSLNSSNTSNDDSSRANLGHIYDFAAAMGAASPASGCSPTKEAASDAGKAVFPGGEVNAGLLEDAIVAAQKAVREGDGDAEKENKNKRPTQGDEEKEVSFSKEDGWKNSGRSEAGGRARGKGDSSLNYNLPVSNFHGGNARDGKNRMEDGSMDDQIIGQILLGRLGLSTCLGDRMDKLEKLRGMWSDGDVRGALKEMENIVDDDEDGAMEGAAVVVDFLKTVEVKRLKLDNCGSLLRVLCKIILGGEDGDGGDFEDTTSGSSTAIRGRPFAGMAMATFATILECFGRLVFQTCLSGGNGFGVGVDVEGEGRLKRCLLCHESFAKLADRICGERVRGGGGEEEEKRGGEGDNKVSSLMFMGLIDMKDNVAKREAKRLAGLLDGYRRGNI
jgi:hypothetical protein